MTTACSVAMFIKMIEHFLELANMSLFDLLGNSVPVVYESKISPKEPH